MYEELMEKIYKKSGMNEEELKVKIDEKKKEFSNLISDEGATHIIAKELGIKIEKKKQSLFIENVVPNIQNLLITAKIMRIFPVREFKTNKASGKVVNIILADTTGSIRMSLWNNEIDILDNFKEGETVEVKGLTKEGYDSAPELRLGRTGQIIKSEEEIDVKEGEVVIKRQMIKDLKLGQQVEVRACILKVFDTLFYYACSQCGTKLKKDNPICEDHKDAAPDYDIIISCIVDDGTESIRLVTFKEEGEKIIGMKKEQAKKIFDENKTLKPILDNIELGKDMIFTGKVRKDDYFKTLQMVVNKVEEIDIKKEIENLNNLS